MKSTNIEHLAEINITGDDCTEIQDKALRDFLEASKVYAAQMRKREMSIRVKRGLQARKERSAIQQEQSR